MMNELIRYVVALTFASSVGIIAVLLVRRPVRLMFGAITSQRAFVRSLGKLSGARCVWRAERSAGCPVLLGVFSPTLILPADFDPSRSLRRVAQLRERDAEGSLGRRGAARGGLRGRRRSRPAGRPPSPLPFQVFASRKAWSCDLLKLPTCVATGCPSLKIIRVGMPRTA